MDLEKSKRKRKALKSATSKFLNHINLDNITDVNELEILLEQLSEKISNLKLINEELLTQIDVDDIEKEVESSETYFEFLISYKCKLKQKIQQISSRNANLSTVVKSSQNTDITEMNKTTIKLPKLTINKYHGDHRYWLEFISQFENAIDKNSSLSKVEKLIYLKNLVGGSAAKAISGFALTENNYDAALNLLKSRFGQTNLLINAHLGSLLNLSPIKNSSDINNLRKLYDRAETEIRNLESLGISSETYGNLLTPIILKALPPDLTLDFSRKNKGDNWDLNALLKFLGEEIQGRERALSFCLTAREKSEPFYNSSQDSHIVRGSRSHTRIKSSANELFTGVRKISDCLFCGSSHDSECCSSLNIDEKRNVLNKKKLCLLCLKPNHRVYECYSKKRCEYCGKKHSKAICHNKNENKKSENSKDNESCGDLRGERLEIISAISSCDDKLEDNKNLNPIFLQTCTVVAENKNKRENVKLFLDNGSQRTFISNDLVNRLKLPVIRKETLAINSFGSKQPKTELFSIVEVPLKNRNDPNSSIIIEAVATDTICNSRLPVPDRNIVRKFEFLHNIELADDFQNDSKEIMILVGSDYYFDIVTGKIHRLDKKLVAVETIFGWCLHGQSKTVRNLLAMNVIVNNYDENLLKQFFDLESIGILPDSPTGNSVDESVIQDFESSITFEERYKVKLPWKLEIKPNLEDNYDVAYKRLNNLLIKLRRDPKLFERYKETIDSYVSEGIIEEVPKTEQLNSDTKFYLPHRAVVREDRTTTKIRVVFDGSSHSALSPSLNDCLYTGPNLTNDIFDVLIRFRNQKIAFVADLKQAFLNIAISEEDRDSCRFLWKDHPFDEGTVKIYRFCRVLFGLTSSPFLLAATINFHLKKHEIEFPTTVKLLRVSLYVDDVIGSEETVEKAFNFSKEAIEIFENAGMELRKWISNSKTLRVLWESNDIPTEHNPEHLSLLPSEHKVLGIGWNSEEDNFYFDTTHLLAFLSDGRYTKRFLLQAAGRIFDPIGYLSPFIVTIKCLIQSVWCAGIDWDDELPEDLKCVFRDWCNGVEKLGQVKIPRYYLINALEYEIRSIELHLFSDASLKAYGCVAYLRIVTCSEQIYTSFVASKSRVSPLKSLSLPRLELMAALLAARLSKKLLKNLNYNNIATKFWTDSTITYFWIKGVPNRFKPFVKNRVVEIQELTQPEHWAHCPGKYNPADLLTRGMKASDMIDSSFWWKGPPFLKQPATAWPGTVLKRPEEDVMEMRKRKDESPELCFIATAEEERIDPERFSTLTRFLRVLAWIRRFILKIKGQNIDDEHLTADEIKEAEECWIKIEQRKAYASEIFSLENGKELDKNSPIRSFAPFLDEKNILRIGGRLENSEFSVDQKHPILLPRNRKFTELIVKNEHENLFHGGVTATLSKIRNRFWISKGRQLIKRITKKCLICSKYFAKPTTQTTSPLPKDRILEAPPFTVCGIDFAGPIFVKTSNSPEKAYICLFTCAVTRALHLELVSNLSTEKFLLALRRFISRRGSVQTIYSDNAKTFKSANKELQRLFTLVKDKAVQTFVSNKRIKWKFIIERAAWWGGFYERLVKSVKECLRKTLGKSLLTFEELATILADIEIVLNQRPLTYVYSDSEEPEPLTPADFLVPGRKIELPIYFTDALFSNRSLLIKRKAFQLKLLETFWKKWKLQYILDLKTAHHLSTPESEREIKTKDVVLIESTNKNKLLWDMGVIQEVFRGRDGKVRGCLVKTNSALIRRPVQLLYPLEIRDNAS